MCLPIFAGVGVALGATAGTTTAAVVGTTAVAAMAASVAAAGMSAYGSYQAGQAQKKMNEYNAKVAENQQVLNKRTAEQNMDLSNIKSSGDMARLMKNFSVLSGKQRATLAAQGVFGESPTAIDIESSTFDTLAEDKATIKYGHELNKWSLENNLGIQNYDLSNQIKLFKMAGKNAATAGNIGAASSLLQGASSVGQNWLMLTK